MVSICSCSRAFASGHSPRSRWAHFSSTKRTIYKSKRKHGQKKELERRVCDWCFAVHGRHQVLEPGVWAGAAWRRQRGLHSERRVAGGMRTEQRNLLRPRGRQREILQPLAHHLQSSVSRVGDNCATCAVSRSARYCVGYALG